MSEAGGSAFKPTHRVRERGAVDWIDVRADGVEPQTYYDRRGSTIYAGIWFQHMEVQHLSDLDRDAIKARAERVARMLVRAGGGDAELLNLVLDDTHALLAALEEAEVRLGVFEYQRNLYRGQIIELTGRAESAERRIAAVETWRHRVDVLESQIAEARRELGGLILQEGQDGGAVDPSVIRADNILSGTAVDAVEGKNDGRAGSQGCGTSHMGNRV